MENKGDWKMEMLHDKPSFIERYWQVFVISYALLIIAFVCSFWPNN